MYEPVLGVARQSTLAHVATGTAAVGAGMIAGLMFSFSVFIMRALARIPPPAGIAAMVAISHAIVTHLFFAVKFGTAAACVAAVVITPDRLRAAAAALYLVGVIGVTSAFNVPLNKHLARVDPNSLAAVEMWNNYLLVWTAWNHVRTASSFLAAVLLVAAMTT
jgi:uncharacterized membrane protein